MYMFLRVESFKQSLRVIWNASAQNTFARHCIVRDDINFSINIVLNIIMKREMGHRS